MTQTVPVLDHGYVVLRNVAGPTRREGQPYDASDRDPAEAARMSFGNMLDARTLEQDMKLAKYLMAHWHTSPFEQIQIWLEMKLPIFVARQFVRHRTCRLNEISGRYVELPAEFYVPAKVGGKALTNKQGQADTLTAEENLAAQSVIRHQCDTAFGAYRGLLDAGVAPEHARLVLPLNTYTHWLWNQDLHNMMHFLALRADSHAQVEAQAYAKAIIRLLRGVLPHTMDLFDEYRVKGTV